MRREVLRLTRYGRFSYEAVTSMTSRERRRWNLALLALQNAEADGMKDSESD